MAATCRTWVVYAVITQALLTGHVQTALVTPRDKLYAHIFENYNNKGFPVLDYRDQIKVGLYVYLVTINKFNELSGELGLGLLFSIRWNEERISWNASDFDGIDSVLVAPTDIWRPQFYIAQSFGSIQEIGNMSAHVRLFNTSYVLWTPANEFKLACTVDVTYFPFDYQLCVITIFSLVYNANEIHKYALSEQLKTDFFLSNNSQWEVLPSRITNGSLNGVSTVDIQLSLKRRSVYYVVYLLIPLLFLGTINNLVFVMPANCGERNSVAVTTFLSFIVYMGIVNNMIPQSSSPIAYMYYYLMFLMAYSSSILFLCILALRIYDRKGKVPCAIKIIVCVLGFQCANYKTCRTGKNNHRTRSQDRNASQQSKKSGRADAIEGTCRTSDELQEDLENDITWFHVGKTFDTFWFVFLYAWFYLGSATTYIVLYTNTMQELKWTGEIR